MPNPSRTSPIVHRWRLVARAVIRCTMAAFASITVIYATVSAEVASGSTLRERSSAVARHVLAAVGHRLVAPVRLEVVNDSSEAILAGFAEVLTEAGHDVRVEPVALQSGTVWTVRRTTSADGVVEGLDVRVEQWPERSVMYSRLWMAEEDEQEEGDGLIERVVVPLTVGAAAALIVYLFFTVRS